MATMRAIRWVRYGPPEGLQLDEIEKPAPTGSEILVRIRAAGITAGDCELRALRFSLPLRILVRLLMGPSRPRGQVLGQEFAGDVESVGPRVKRFRVGDAVYGTTGFDFGAYAEYLCLSEFPRGGAVARKPKNLTYAEAATVPTGGLEALLFLRKGGNLADRRVLIVGAGGGIGMFAVQLAKCFRAEVTGVDRPPRLEVARSVGADRLIDYTREDVFGSSDPYDVIFDAVGRDRFGEVLQALRGGGRYLLVNPDFTATIRARLTSAAGHRKVVVRVPAPVSEDLDFLTDLIEAGRILPVVDRQFPIGAICEAHSYVDLNQARGRVVLLP